MSALVMSSVFSIQLLLLKGKPKDIFQQNDQHFTLMWVFERFDFVNKSNKRE